MKQFPYEKELYPVAPPPGKININFPPVFVKGDILNAVIYQGLQHPVLWF